MRPSPELTQLAHREGFDERLTKDSPTASLSSRAIEPCQRRRAASFLGFASTVRTWPPKPPPRIPSGHRPVIGTNVLAQIFAQFPEVVVGALGGTTGSPQHADGGQDLFKFGESRTKVFDAKVHTRPTGSSKPRLAPAVKLFERPSKCSIGLFELEKNSQGSISRRCRRCGSRVALRAKEQPDTHSYPKQRTRPAPPFSACRKDTQIVGGALMRKRLPILVACEYSDTVASAFRAFGFDVYSCHASSPVAAVVTTMRRLGAAGAPISADLLRQSSDALLMS